MKERIVTWTAVVVLSITLGGAAVLGIDHLRGTTKSSAPAVITNSVPARTSNVSNNAVQDVADLYASVRPSIVRITGQASRTGSGGLGSGIVLDSKGYILTNNHVVNGFDRIDVTLSDGTAASATVVGTDPGNDLAVVKVNLAADKLKPATLGDSDQARIGDLVVAVGNPFSLDGSVTEGIISGQGRTLSGGTGRPLRQLIQSDAAINPGNSGGALFDRNGSVIGITTAIENPSGQNVFVGIGYAIPINAAKRFLPDLIAGKTVQHPRMGVGLQDVTPAIAGTLNLNVQQGVLITSVDPSSAAARAGLKGGTGSGRSPTPGDVVVAIDGHEVKSFNDLANYIDTKNVGDKVELKIVREGKDASINLTLDAWQG
jgi:serine protease Do